MSEMVFVLSLIFWAAVNYLVVKVIVDKNPGFKAEPALYALGSLFFGGLYPLLFLAVKYLLWWNKNK